MSYKALPTQGLPGVEAAAPNAGWPESAVSERSHRDLWTSLLLGLVCLVVYNANLRSVGAGDTYPARYLPFGILRYHTVLLDPISNITAQGRTIARVQGRTNSAFWIVRGRGDHAISLYPVVVPLYRNKQNRAHSFAVGCRHLR
jgi:hypothetical protein